MTDTLYIEEAVLDHPRTQSIIKRYPKARIVHCERYSEVFNPSGQNFRLQKQNPALILAGKHKNFVLPAPLSYNIGGRHNYYFSHMLNCIFDCRYCFLQGMYRSANYVLFVNFEEFADAITEQAAQYPGEQSYFFSGYDCDSLALEPVTGFAAHMLPRFREQADAVLELRSKSLQIQPLLNTEAFANCVVAFSLSPQAIIDALEHGTPSLEKRLAALAKLQERGWPIGLRFDPVVYSDDFQTMYGDFFKQVFSVIDGKRVHSVSLGAFRMPQGFFRNMVRLYPAEKLFAAKVDDQQAMAGYPAELESDMLGYCRQSLLNYIDEQSLYICQDND